MSKTLSPQDKARNFQRAGLPVFLDMDGELCLRHERGPCRRPVAIASVPKSGTYLFGELLENLGIRFSGIHIATYGLQDLRDRSNDFIIAHAEETFATVPCRQVLPLIRPGQFVVSHFPCEPWLRNLLKPFKVLFTYRDLRDTMVSTMRWIAKKAQLADRTSGWEYLPHGPEKMATFLKRHGEHYLEVIKQMREWPRQPGVLTLSFEEIQGDFGADQQRDAVRGLAEFLGLSASPAEITLAIQRTLGANTLTYSGKRSDRLEVWSDEVEDFFLQHDVDELEDVWRHAPRVRSFAFRHEARIFTADELACPTA